MYNSTQSWLCIYNILVIVLWIILSNFSTGPTRKRAIKMMGVVMCVCVCACVRVCIYSLFSLSFFLSVL